MKIGEKIRELRVSKLMTQSELAGKKITRNMLSCIENGSAQPSLDTLLYLAERLNIPAGFLLAEEGDETVFRKMNSLPNIKRAYTAGDLYGCRSLCLSVCTEPDDELMLLLSECDLGIAKEELEAGHLRSACRFFDEALEYAEKTLYPAERVKAEASVFFRYLERISVTLYSEVFDADEATPYLWKSPFSDYVSALEALEKGDPLPARTFLSSEENRGSFFFEHLEILLLSFGKDFRAAKERILQLLKSDTKESPVSLYELLSELEVCCRETEDFKGAYFYANEKIRLAEQLLSETV